MLSKVKEKVARIAKGSALIASAVALGSSIMLIVTASGVTVENSDVTQVNDANTIFLTSSFGVLAFLKTLALLAAGMYILNKIFSFVPKWGGGA